MTCDVTCFVPYHGRNWLIMEAVESFRRLTLDGITAELLILNDCPEQELSCTIPGVRILQGVEPYRTLSAKWNVGVAEARGKWIAAWDDDDIVLPRRIVEGVAAIGDEPMFWNPWVFSMCHQRGHVDQIGRTWLCNSLFRRDAFLAAGGNDPDDWNDRSTFNLLKMRSVRQSEPDPARIHYVYRWAGEMHDSGHTDAADVRVRRFREAVLADRRFARGEHAVVPWWTMDYEAAVADAIRRKVKVDG